MADKSTTKTVLITGASGGIGKAFAELLASEGHELILVARNADALNRIAGVETAQHQIKVTVIPLDLTRQGAVASLIEELETRGVLPDVVINNAGVGLVGAASDLDVEAQMQIIKLNVCALSELTLGLLPKMKARNSGGFINISSTAAFMPGPYMAVYYASKAYVQSFSTALDEELKASGVRVMSVCPGPVDTGFQAHADMDTKRLIYKLMGPLSAKEVAQAGWFGYKAGDRRVIPGVMNYLTVMSVKFLPNWAMMPIVKLFQKPKKR